MIKRIVLSIFTILISAYVISAQIDAPTLTPVPSTDDQQSLIREGVVLHDHKDYDGAIRKYEEVLKVNPDNVDALWELSYSYSAKEDHAKSLEISYRGARYKSKLLAGFYTSIANNLDNLGESKKAVEIYKAAIKLTPDYALLHYNLAVTYRKLGMFDDARKSVKRAVVFDPDRPSSHLVLGELFYSSGYRTPAFLAMSRFLVLEPKSERSATAYNVVLNVLQGGVSVDDKSGNIKISLEKSPKKDEGDFDVIDLSMGLSKAADSLEENKGKTKAQLAVEQLNTFLSILSELDQKENKSKFVFRYYVPYFIELKKRNYVEPFYYYISRSDNNSDVEKWLGDNFRRVSEFLNWSKQYQWPRIKD